MKKIQRLQPSGLTIRFPRIAVINGPNLNLLGTREPEIYGSTTLEDIHHGLMKKAEGTGAKIVFHQSNHEGEIVEMLQNCQTSADGIIINPAAYTHTSVAIRDAISFLDLPVIEVHISNIYKREPFRHKSMISDVVTGTIAGLGHDGYFLAFYALLKRLGTKVDALFLSG